MVNVDGLANMLPRIWSWDIKKNMQSKNIAKPLLILGTILIFWISSWINEMIVSHLGIGNHYSTMGKLASILLPIGILFICLAFLFIIVSLVYCAPKSQLYVFTSYIWIAYLAWFPVLIFLPLVDFLFNPQLGFHVSFGPPGGYQISTIVFLTPILFSLMAESYLTGRLKTIIYRLGGKSVYGIYSSVYLVGAMISMIIMISFIYQTITEHIALYDFHLLSSSDFESIIITISFAVIISTALFIISVIFEWFYDKMVPFNLR